MLFKQSLTMFVEIVKILLTNSSSWLLTVLKTIIIFIKNEYFELFKCL